MGPHARAWSCTLPEVAGAILEGMRDRGILINRTHDTVLRFLPPFLITREHVDQTITRRSTHLFQQHAPASARGHGRVANHLVTLATQDLTSLLPVSKPRSPRTTGTKLSTEKHKAMATKTIMMTPQDSTASVTPKPTVTLGIQSDAGFTEAAKALQGRDLCSITDLSVQEMAAIMELAHAVKRTPEDFRHALDAQARWSCSSRRASLRTRLTFEVAMKSTSAVALAFVDQTASPLGERESIPDIARNLERWMDVIVLRTLLARNHHRDGRQLARTRHQRAQLIVEHPCQAIADFMTLEERFGPVDGLKFTYIGDGNNVCHSLMLTAAQLGAHCTVCTPKGFEPKLDIIHKAMAIAETTGGSHRPHPRPRRRREGSRRGLHRRLHQHGPGARSRPPRTDLQSHTR